MHTKSLEWDYVQSIDSLKIYSFWKLQLFLVKAERNAFTNYNLGPSP